MNEKQPNEAANDRMKELLHAAYPSETPSDSLQHKLEPSRGGGRNRMERTRSPRPFRKLALVGALAGAAVLAVAAWNYLFNRAGEAAVALIPQDADVVVTVDLNPGESQVGTFKRIADALKAEGLDDKFDQLLSQGLEQSPFGSELRSYMTRSLAAALWAPTNGSKDTRGVLLFAVSDPAAVENLLRKNLRGESREGITVYQIPQLGNGYGAVIGAYLAMGDSPETLARIKGVGERAEPSLASLPEYLTARAALPLESNVMLFVSPKAMNELNKEAKQYGTSPLAGTSWMALGMTLRDEGIAFNYRCPVDARALPGLATLSKIEPLDMNVLRKLPNGAFGALAVSQPGAYYNVIEDSMEAGGDEARSAFEQSLREFEQQTGLNVTSDVLPAFQGTAVLAVYPSANKEPDGIVLFNDDHGADPAALLGKLRELFQREAEKAGKPMEITESTRGSAEVWEVKAEDSSLPEDKLIVVKFGKAVMLCSSNAIANRAIEASAGGRTLADDTDFASMQAQLEPNAQGALMISLARIMEKVRPMIEEGLADSGSPVTADDIVGIFGSGNVGLVASARYDGDVAIGSMFLPLNYEGLIKVIGAFGDMGPQGPSHKDPKVDIDAELSSLMRGSYAYLR